MSGAAFNRSGGHTSCVEVQAGPHRLIFDAGTGIIGLGNEMLKEWAQGGKERKLKVFLFFSHMHHDHNQGFPFFKPLYLAQSVCYVFGPRTFWHGLEEVIARSMVRPFFPVELSEVESLRFVQHVCDSHEIVIDEKDEPQAFHRFEDAHRLEGIGNHSGVVRIKMFRDLAHPRDGVIVYRIEHMGKSVVYATDVEGYVGGDQRLARFARGADVLIHDAQYSEEKYLGVPTQGFGHSTPAMAVQVAKAAGARRLVLFHHDPDSDDEMVDRMEAQGAEAMPGTLAAREGMVIEV